MLCSTYKSTSSTSAFVHWTWIPEVQLLLHASIFPLLSLGWLYISFPRSVMIYACGPPYPAQCSNCPIYLAFFNSTKVKLCKFFSFLCLTYFTQHNVQNTHIVGLSKVNLWRCQCFTLLFMLYLMPTCLQVLVSPSFLVCLRIHLQCKRPGSIPGSGENLLEKG